MTIEARLDAAIAPFRLLEHPFYQAWNAGTLPVEALVDYARQYGVFIGMIGEGWTTLGVADHAEEEAHHATLWAEFAKALGTPVGGALCPDVKALLETSRELFASPTTALGALYAFEAQQPATAATKRVGLDAHYDVPEAAKRYFDIHANDLHEAEMLRERMAGASEQTLADIEAACATMSQALWNALSGVTPEAVAASCA